MLVLSNSIRYIGLAPVQAVSWLLGTLGETMLPLQEINIETKRGHLFAVHLEKRSEEVIQCKFAAIYLGRALPADATFELFSQGTTADVAFKNLISKLRNSLDKLDPSDAIKSVDNTCNAELLSAEQQRKVLNSNVLIRVNGQDA